MTALLADPAALRRRIEAIQLRRHDGIEEGIEIEALAEAYFRLSVDTATPAEEALDLLRRAIRLDGANPKLPYHMARLYFVHGEFDRAADWLAHAHAICPTSHRVWAHVILLQQELNARYNEDDRKEQHALRDRARAIAVAVLAGDDAIDVGLLDFTAPDSVAHKEQIERRLQNDRAYGADPGLDGGDGRAAPPTATAPAGPRRPGALPRRLGDTGLCRWSGVNDLLAEAIMGAGEPSRRSQATLAQLLEQVTRRRQTRPGGDGAVAIAAIQAIVSGYPIALARPLLDALLAGAPTPALELLELVCALFQADEAAVPRMLAEALEEGRIPPLLAAVVHQRRLLWRPMSLGTLGLAYRAARAHATAASSPEAKRDADIEEAMRFADELERAARELEAKRPAVEPEPAVDRTAEPSDPAALLAAAEELSRRREQLWSRLRELKAARAARELEAGEVAELDEIAAFVEQIASEPVRAIARLDELKARGAAATAQDGATIEKARDVFAQLTSRVTPFRKQLAVVRPEPAPAAAPAAGALEGAPSDAEPQAAPDAAAGLPRLEQVLDLVLRRVQQRFADAHATFDAYSPAARRLPAILALQRSVTAREAEALYRLGRIPDARRAWSRILREDSLDLRALKNVAVADAADLRNSRDLGSWRRYAETLYYYDIVAGSPHLRAPERRELHRELGRAYAPAQLSIADRADAMEAFKKIDQTVLIGFLGSRARVRLFVHHTLLEILNARLRFTSPPLILGVTRTESEALRTRARDEMLVFVDGVCELVPQRVRAPFADLCATRIHAAYRACGSAERLTRERDPAYDVEVGEQIALIKEICELKYRLYALLTAGRNHECVIRLDALDVLNDLAQLDRAPIAGSPELLRKAAAGDVGIEASVFPRMLSRARGQFLKDAGSEDRVLAAALGGLATDDRDAELAALTCGVAVDRARATGSASRLGELVITLDGWVERARSLVEREDRDGFGVLDAGEELTRTAVDTVARGFDRAAAGVACAEFGDLGERTDWDKLVGALDALLASSELIAAGSEAYYVRMIAGVNALSAIRDAGARRPRIEAIGSDARAVLERSPDESQRAEADRTLALVTEALAQPA